MNGLPLHRFVCLSRMALVDTILPYLHVKGCHSLLCSVAPPPTLFNKTDSLPSDTMNVQLNT